MEANYVEKSTLKLVSMESSFLESSSTTDIVCFFKTHVASNPFIHLSEIDDRSSIIGELLVELRPGPNAHVVYIDGAFNLFHARHLEKSIASPGHGILIIDESNATREKRLASVGLDNTAGLDNTEGKAYRKLLLTTHGLGEYNSGAIMFEETLYQ